MSADRTFRNDRLTYRLNLVAQEAIDANDAIFQRATGCRIRELRVLRLIDDSPGTTFNAIARTTGFERSLTSRIIQTLIGQGLIARETSAEDARVFLLSTTPAGRQVREVARGLSDRLEVILTAPLSAQDKRALDDILARLGAWVGSAEYHAALREAREDAAPAR